MTDIARLESLLSKLNDRDREFAQSLVNQAAKRSLSDRQCYWVSRLIERAEGSEGKSASVEIADGLDHIIDMFNHAKGRLKRPGVLLDCDDRVLRITVAGSASQQPGSLNVVDKDSRDWLGRLTTSGTWEPSRRQLERSPAVAAVLTAFSADPAGVAAAFGKRTGRCCFCNHTLDDERSTAVGYGPVCADNFGLPWGARHAKHVIEAADEYVPAQLGDLSDPYNNRALYADRPSRHMRMAR